MKLETTQTVPLTMLDNGAIRITGTRVSLDSIIFDYKQNLSAEQIHENFPVVKLEDIYAAIWYYLQHQDEVETYLQEQAAKAELLRQEIEAQPQYQAKVSAFRERVESWRTTQAQSEKPAA
jgi:uncharacterized protein (DUF433 family)